MTAAAKAALRVAAKAARDALASPGAAQRVAAHVLDSGLIPAGACVSGYLAIGSELDPAPLLAALHDRRHVTLLPVVVARDRPLLFRRWTPGDALVKGPLGTSMPVPGALAESPDVLLVPLLAFDEAGYRLGYGGGYYDRTLRMLRAAGEVTAIGLAYAGQEMASLPRGGTDEPVDAIATEHGVRMIR